MSCFQNKVSQCLSRTSSVFIITASCDCWAFFVVPDEVEDVKGALSQFQVEFSNRYGLGPQFEADTLPNAMQKAFGAEARKRKLLGEFLYFLLILSFRLVNHRSAKFFYSIVQLLFKNKRFLLELS